MCTIGFYTFRYLQIIDITFCDITVFLTYLPIYFTYLAEKQNHLHNSFLVFDFETFQITEII